jgi:hypothetical protein
VYFNSASATLQERANQLVEKNFSLKTARDIAIVDRVLSQSEVELIVEGAGEKLESGE